jgi:hypothetical protein
MKKLIAIIFASFLFSFTPAVAVEFGQDATGDSNAVKVGGASGFLYSERIVITVGHVIEGTGGLAYWERYGVIYKPGIVNISGQKGYRVKKVIMPSTYVTPDYKNNIIVDDLAVIVLSEDMPVTKKAVLATEEQMKRFVKDKSKVELVGYGITNGSQRNRPWEEIVNRPPNKLTSTLISPEMVIQFYKQYPYMDWEKINKPGVYGIVQDREAKQSHICDGDSGSVFFVEENNVRYVLGTTGLGLVNNNCPPPGKERWLWYPSMSWIDPASKLPSLIKIAEEIVAEDKRKEFAQAEEVRLAAELKAKQEAEARSKAEAEAKLEAERVAAEEKIKAEIAEKNALILKTKKAFAGKSCTKIKRTTVVAELVKFTCIKKNKKLVWNNGVVLNN